MKTDGLQQPLKVDGYFVDDESPQSVNVNDAVFVAFVGDNEPSAPPEPQNNSWWGSRGCCQIQSCQQFVRNLACRVSCCRGDIESGCSISSIPRACLGSIEFLGRCSENRISEMKQWAARNAPAFACLGLGAILAIFSVGFGSAYQSCVDRDSCNETVQYSSCHTDNGQTHCTTRTITVRQEYFETAISTACISAFLMALGAYGFCGGDIGACFTRRR